MIKTVDKILGNPEGHSLDLITYVTDRLVMMLVMQLIVLNFRRNLAGNQVFSLRRELRRLFAGTWITRSGWIILPRKNTKSITKTCTKDVKIL